jgi:hypothetical protein
MRLLAGYKLGDVTSQADGGAVLTFVSADRQSMVRLALGVAEVELHQLRNRIGQPVDEVLPVDPKPGGRVLRIKFVDASELGLAFDGELEVGELAAQICKACNGPVIREAHMYEVFEEMHWSCFHRVYEHDFSSPTGDPDIACSDPSCPARAHDPDPQPANWHPGRPA